MEDVLEVYSRPYDPAKPVICMDDYRNYCFIETNPQFSLALLARMCCGLMVCFDNNDRVYEHRSFNNDIRSLFSLQAGTASVKAGHADAIASRLA